MAWYEQLMAILPGLHLNTARCLHRSLHNHVHPRAVLSMTDDDLLSLRNFGPVHLACLRAVWPEPVHDGWFDHAVMVTGVSV